jgi:hypothetical protein
MPNTNTDIVPLISSLVTGPLGLRHFPRVWLKVLLHTKGRLPEGYRHGYGGFDERLATHVGLDMDAFVAFVTAESPTYLASEDWLRANATALTNETIASFNEIIRSTDKSEENAVKQRADIGIPDWTLKNAVALNDLDDWTAIHAQLV